MVWTHKIFAEKIGGFFVCVSVIAATGTANSAYVPSNFISPPSYNTMQPFMNDTMRMALRSDGADNSPDQTAVFSRSAVGAGNTPVSQFVRQNSDTATSTGRRVVARSATNANVSVQQRKVVSRGAGTARSGVALPQSQAFVSNARVSVSPTISLNRKVAPRTSRSSTTISSGRTTSAETLNVVAQDSVSASQCLADYKSCMDGYCQRKNTIYNRCYCGADLARIETTLRPQVEEVLRQLMIIKNGGIPSSGMTNAELEELWRDTFYQYTGTNDMASLNSALNIEWPDEASNMRGQNAFAMGHEYCVQHLRGCFYMATNLRDSYRSDIARDCTSYESYLNKLKLAGEAVISHVEE